MASAQLNIQLDPDSVNVELQTRQWDTVINLSNLIIEQMSGARWDTVRVLADQREALIHEFFSNPIAMKLYQRVLNDVAEIQAQNITMVKQLSLAQQANQTREKHLEAVRADVRARIETDHPQAFYPGT